MDSQTTMLQKLEALINTYSTNYTSPDAILVLQKTFQSHNITIEDWNQLLTFVQENFEILDLPGLYALLEQIIYEIQNIDCYSREESDARFEPIIDSEHMLDADLVDDTSSTHKFVTESEKSTWSNKQNSLTSSTGIDITGDIISVDTTVIATKLDLESYATKSELEYFTTQVYINRNNINRIQGLIPAQASSSNKLADKDFVNSSIATSRATFRGTYNVVTDLGLTTSATHSEIATAIATKLASLSIVPDDNDYCYVAYPDATVSTQYTQFDEYKFNGTVWEYEFTLNNSSFTAAQWATINSGITSTKVGNYDAHLSNTNNPHSVTKAQVGLGNVDNYSLVEIKSILTGTIVSGDPRFATGGDVYSALQNKVDATGLKTINSTSILGSGNIDTKELFYCTYGTTTYAEITQALSAGKIPVCIYNDRLYSLASYSSTIYRFSSAQSDYIRYITINDSNVWAASAYNLQLVSNKVPSISSVSTDTEYPSAKAVYDYAQPVINNLNKLNSDLVDDTNSTNKFVTASDKTTWNSKSTVSVSNTGTATDEVNYITINGVEKKIGGGGSVLNGVAYEEVN